MNFFKLVKLFFEGSNDNLVWYKNNNIIHHFYRVLLYPGYRIVWLLRIGKALPAFLKKIYKPYFIYKSRKYLFDIDLDTKFGEGLIFSHNGPITINYDSIIGRNCSIHPCVLIGGNRMKKGSPKIGDNVFIGHGSKIIGNLKIGDYVFISPGAIITKDIHSNSVVGSGLNNILYTDKGKEYFEKYGPINIV